MCFSLFDSKKEKMSKLVVYGGAGALGRALVQHFKTKGYVCEATWGSNCRSLTLFIDRDQR